MLDEIKTPECRFISKTPTDFYDHPTQTLIEKIYDGPNVNIINRLFIYKYNINGCIHSVEKWEQFIPTSKLQKQKLINDIATRKHFEYKLEQSKKFKTIWEVIH